MSIIAALWSLMLRLWRDFWQNPQQVRYIIPLLCINVPGSIYGFYWYREQLAATPVYFWPFVPDSPLSSSLFVLALLLSLFGFHKTLLQVLACSISIKYGIWAVVMISQYWASGGALEATEAMLWISHLGMAVEGAVFLRAYSFGRAGVLTAGAWMLLNDLMDYGASLHPYLFMAGQTTAAMLTAFTLTALLLLILWVRRVD
ncbi:MAG: DUF1405 domain-containing protein [Pelotomaculum sp.]|jgi:uncharacterized membrane protein YpjA